MSDTTRLEELMTEIEKYFKLQKNYAVTNNTSALEEMKEQKNKLRNLIQTIKAERANKKMLALWPDGK